MEKFLHKVIRKVCRPSNIQQIGGLYTFNMAFSDEDTILDQSYEE